MTRCYPSAKAPAAIFHGKASGTWGIRGFSTWYNPVPYIWLASLHKESAGLANSRTCETDPQANYDVYYARWWLGPFSQNENITGTFDLCQMVGANWMNGAAGPTADSI